MLNKTTRNNPFPQVFLLFLIFVFSTFTVFSFQTENAYDTKQLKLLDINDLDKWEQMSGNASLSNDGKWLVYNVRKNNRESELRLHNLNSGTVKVLAESASQRVSGDNRWFGFIVSPDAKTQDKLREEKKPIIRKFGLLNLLTDETIYVNDVDSFSFSSDGKFVAIKKTPPENSDIKTANVIIRDLASGKDRVFGNVKDFAWSENGTLLAILTDLTDKIGNAVTLFDGRTQSLQILDTQEAVYSNLSWRNNSEDLAVLRSYKDKNYDEDNNEILVWRELAKSISNPKIFKPTNFASIAKDLKIASRPNLRWSADGKSLFFVIDKWKKKDDKKDEVKTDEPKAKLPEIPALEIWNANDVKAIPQQKSDSNEASFLSVWHMDSDKFVKLGDGNLNIRFQNNSPILLASDGTPYQFEEMFGRPSNDIYTVDIRTGNKKKILNDNPFFLSNSVSQGGKYFVYVQDNNYHLYDLTTSKTINLTQDIDDSFVNLEDDHPMRQKTPFGFVGWDQTGSYFIAHSKFDVWKFEAASGKGTKITNGKSSGIEYRYERADFGNSTVDLNQPYRLRRFDSVTKKMGYSLSDKGNVSELFWGESVVSGVVKAKNADVTALKIESYNDSPDYFIMQNGSSNLKQISNINAFEKEYKAGKAEVIQFTNAQGQKLQGSLYYPDDYVAGKKYPMITYIYELLSDGFYRNTVPSNTNYYNRRVFTSQGYFVFMPDIVFEPGNPGVSSVKTLEIAVKAVVDKGLVDEKRVGLVGHSWGGYQAAYAVTGTNIFAAAVAGAGISNLVTMYGTLTPAFGNTFESNHFEVGQERMIVPPWKDMEGYLRNSAIPNIEKMQTPLLMEVGDADVNVNWGQGLEMYNAARREKKPMVLLVYAKEGHGLREPKNQIDYQKRILEWFAHYLKNEPAKRWIKDNIPYKEQQKLLKERELE